MKAGSYWSLWFAAAAVTALCAVALGFGPYRFVSNFPYIGIYNSQSAVPAGPQSNTEIAISALLPLGTTTPVRLNPELVAISAKASDPELGQWFKEWKEIYLGGGHFSPGLARRLQICLQRSQLSAVDLLNFAHAFHFVSQDIPTSAVIYQAASLRIESELAKPELTAEQSVPLLLAIEYHMQDYKDVLWPLIESGRQQYAETLNRIYSNLIRSVPATSNADLIKGAKRPMIGSAECLYILGEYDESQRVLEEFSAMGMTTGDKIAWSWPYALVLIHARRDEEAQSHLRFVVENGPAPFATAANRLLGRYAEYKAKTQSSASLATQPAETESSTPHQDRMEP